MREGGGPQILFVHVLALTLKFILYIHYIPLSIISSAVQHVLWTLDFRPSAYVLGHPGFRMN